MLRRASKTYAGRAAAVRAGLGRGSHEPRGAPTLRGRWLGPGREQERRERPAPGFQNEGLAQREVLEGPVRRRELIDRGGGAAPRSSTWTPAGLWA